MGIRQISRWRVALAQTNHGDVISPLLEKCSGAYCEIVVRWLFVSRAVMRCRVLIEVKDRVRISSLGGPAHCRQHCRQKPSGKCKLLFALMQTSACVGASVIRTLERQFQKTYKSSIRQAKTYKSWIRPKTI